MKRNKEVLSRQAALLPFTLSFLQAFCFVKGFFFRKHIKLQMLCCSLMRQRLEEAFEHSDAAAVLSGPL